MSLFNSLLNAAVSAVSGGGQQGVAVQLISQLLQQHGGKIGDLLAQLQQGGLGDALQSWIGSGANQAVSAEQIQQALGSGLQQAAEKVGVAQGEAGNVLAQYLPQLINSITPNGNAADADGFGVDDIVRVLTQQLLK